MKHVSYASVVVSLVYAMVYIIRIFSQSISVVNVFTGHPGKAHWEAMKWILCYLRANANIGLVYGKNPNPTIYVVGFIDYDYAGDLDKKISSIGSVFYIFWFCH